MIFEFCLPLMGSGLGLYTDLLTSDSLVCVRSRHIFWSSRPTADMDVSCRAEKELGLLQSAVDERLDSLHVALADQHADFQVIHPSSTGVAFSL